MIWDMGLWFKKTNIRENSSFLKNKISWCKNLWFFRIPVHDIISIYFHFLVLSRQCIIFTIIKGKNIVKIITTR